MLILTREDLQKNRENYKMPVIAKYLTDDNYLTDNEVFIDPARIPHMLIGGINGSGKSSWINAIIASLLHERFILLGVDCKRGVELSPWKNRFTSYAKTPEEATTLVENLYKIVDERMIRLEKAGLRSWPTYWEPRIIFIIDEISQYLAERVTPRTDETYDEAIKRSKREKFSRKNNLFNLAAISRAAGVTLVLCTQNPKSDILPTEIRSELDLRVCCRIKDSQSYGVILGHGSDDSISDTLAPSDIPSNMQGTAFIDWGGDRIRKARSIWYTDEQIAEAMHDFDYARWAEHYNINSDEWN